MCKNCKDKMDPERREELWKLINEYVVSCHGHPHMYVYGNINREKLVVDIEKLINGEIAGVCHHVDMSKIPSV